MRTDPVLPQDNPDVPDGPSIQAEFLIGWRLPEGVERPAHFPSPAEAGEDNGRDQELPLSLRDAADIFDWAGSDEGVYVGIAPLR